MCETLQFKDMNVLEHGISVNKHYVKLIKDLESSSCSEEILIKIYNKIKDKYQIYKYQIYHDCGKPFCLSIDNDNKRHFIDHANHSYNQLKLLFPNDYKVLTLMKNDMEFHINKDLNFLWNLEFSETLYLTAWAEIYSNSEMFGGINSTSFKIKRKKLIKAGKFYLENIL